MLVLALIAWGVVEALTLDGAGPPALRVAFVGVVFGPLVVADRHPMPVAALLLVGLAVNGATQLLSNDEAVTPLQAILLVGWIAGHAPAGARRASAALVLAVVAVLAIGRLDDLPPLGTAAAVALAWLAARVVRESARRRAAEAERLAAVRPTGPGEHRAEVQAERRRLAAEIDGGVLRAVIGIRRDVAAAAALLEPRPAEARDALRRAATATGEALARLRRSLDLLAADHGQDAPPAAAPADLLAAATALRAAGTTVRIADRGAGEPSAELAGARVLGLLAALDPLPDRVDVRRRAGLVVRARLTGGPRDGAVLARIAERARRHGGRARLRRALAPGRPGTRILTVRLPTAAGDPAAPGSAAWTAGALAAGATAADLASSGGAGGPGALAAALLTGVVVALAWTRRPLALALLAAAPLAREAVVDRQLDDTTVPLLALAAFLPALWLDGAVVRRRIAAVVAAAGVALVAGWWLRTGVQPTDAPVAAFPLVVAWALGAAVRDRTADAERLLAARLTRTREELEATQRARDDERRRVAADLHDLVGHGLALLSVQAWGAERALAVGDAGTARRSTDALAGIVERVLSELEQLLRREPGEEHGPPPPLPVLVDEARRAGLPVAGIGLELAGDLPPEHELLLRRATREALTNVARHAGPVATRVEVLRTERTVELGVRNAAPPAGGRAAVPGTGGGRGLATLRDEAAALGAVLRVEPGDGFALRLALPAAGSRPAVPVKAEPII